MNGAAMLRLDNSTGNIDAASGTLDHTNPTRHDEQHQALLESYDSEDEPASGHATSSAASFHRSTADSLTFLNCLALVVGIQIGSGIFSAPAVTSSHVATPLAGILVWTLSGLLVWTGALSFIELGTNVPLNGGMQEYLRAAYGDFAGFVFSCVWLSIVRPCSIAMIAMVVAEHITGVVLPALSLQGGWAADKAIALLAVWGITAVNCLGVITGAKVAIWFLALKLLLIASIVMAGLIVAIRESGGHLFKAEEEWTTGSTALREVKVNSGVWQVFGEYVTAGFAALWVYGGWEAVGFVVGEMRDPVRDLPRVINLALSITITSFTLTVTAFYVVLPMSKVQEKDTPAVAFAKALYGSTGVLIYTIAISLSALGALNSNVFAIGRLAVAASQRRYIPRVFAVQKNTSMTVEREERWLREKIQKLWPAWAAWSIASFVTATRSLRLEGGVPVYAMFLNALLASIYLMLGTFHGLLTFIGITEYLVFIFTVLALFRLRASPPSPQSSSSLAVPASSKTAYRVNTMYPVIFSVLSIFLVGRGVITEPLQGAALAAVFGIIWVIWRRKERVSSEVALQEE